MNRETFVNELQNVSFEGGHDSFKYLKTSDFHLQWIYEVWTSALVPWGYGHSSPEYGKPNIKLHQSRLCNFDWKEFLLLLFHLYSCKSYPTHTHTHASSCQREDMWNTNATQRNQGTILKKSLLLQKWIILFNLHLHESSILKCIFLHFNCCLHQVYTSQDCWH